MFLPFAARAQPGSVNQDAELTTNIAQPIGGVTSMINKSYHNFPYALSVAFCLLVAGGLTGCSMLPSSGPYLREVRNQAPPEGIQLVDLTGEVAAKLLARQKRALFSEVFGTNGLSEYVVGTGDVLTASVWEAPPATLFSSSAVVAGSAAGPVPPSSQATTIPDQMVNSNGMIIVPFAGQIHAGGRTLRQIEIDIKERLSGMAHQPQVLVRLTGNASANVTVVGEVGHSVRMPLTPHGERLLDALAAAGGAKPPVGKTMIQVTRGKTVEALPLDSVIRDPNQNILLHPGDVVTALFQPLSFTVLGAVTKNDEITFEAQGISLVQALARAAGLQDNRANPQGAFIFRLEPADLLDWPTKPVLTTSDGKVPVIYRVNLKDPAVFFAAENFPVRDKDLVYVSNAPVAEFQKFANIIMSIGYPVAISSIELTK